ncbi:MAG: HAMP domain-containing sensor histidine kinase, partial [Chthoniobacteraceae bacterium]
QQGHASVSGLAEDLDLAELVEDTLRMSAETLSRHRVQVIREFDAVPPVVVEKHKVLQILVNLVCNAKHACEAVDRPDRTLTVRVFHGDGSVNVAVADNGIGIPQENLVRVFNHGFTTKQNGHGFGLHSGALAAREIGGSLQVESGGPGQGATFTLKIPAAQAV